MSQVDLSVIGMKTDPVVFEYTWKDVVLYALGVGASGSELHLVYEGVPGGLKVLPSFCLVPAMRAFPGVGQSVDLSRFLHGEQGFRLHRPLPMEGRIVVQGEVKNIWDKGKAAVYDIEINGRLEDGTPLFDTQWTNFYLNAGGFGGDSGPKAVISRPPEGVKPDFSISQRVADNQAALYRLNGDLNPLHVDPAFARGGGFDQPILHGLCTYGFAVRGIVNGVLDGQTERLTEFKARFSSPVFMGDVLTTECWRDGSRLIVQTRTERGPVMTNAAAVIG